jgi:RNA polymerase sigma-70 factor (sigma-E family)
MLLDEQVFDEERLMRRPWPEPVIERAPGYTDFVVARAAPMLAMARGLTRSSVDAEDLVQEVLAKALLKWDVIRKVDDPPAYVNRMLVNTAISFWRTGLRREATTASGELPPQSVDDRSGELAERDALLAALRQLPPRHRAVLVLRYYEGLPDQEIAQVLGMAQATVRSSAARGLAALRKAGLLTEESV